MIVGIGIDSVEINRFKNWKTYQYVKLRRIFSENEIAYCLAAPTKIDERFALRFAAREAFLSSYGSPKQPHVVAVAYTDHLAVMDENNDVIQNNTVGPKQPDITIPIINDEGEQKFLWKGLVSGEGWFVSAQFQDD